MSKMYCRIEELYNTCGVTLLSSFSSNYGDAWCSGDFTPRLGGAGLAVAGFVDTPTCKDMYKHLSNKFNIVYQSSVRKNRSSGRNFFIVIYDGKKPKPKKAQPVVYNFQE